MTRKSRAASIDRRNFNRLLAAGTASSLLFNPAIARAAKQKIVIIGGGAGGATAARYLARDAGQSLSITLIEPNKQYATCFFANLYLGDFFEYDRLSHGYDRLANRYDINVVHDAAIMIDRDQKEVRLLSGPRLPYDRLIVAPGIDFAYDSVPGYSVAASHVMPHAYKSGTQVKRFRHLMDTLPEGGTFLMLAPPNPYRCPPGPYERVSMMAHRFKRTNPTAKIIILDPKESFSKQALFMRAWESYYPGMIEWIPASIYGSVESVDVAACAFETEFDTFKADAASVIPAQTAGQIAITAGLADDDGWCPIDPASMRSQKDENIFVLGDSSNAGAMPKSAFSANSQAKVAAMVIQHELTGTPLYPARYANTCWSLMAENDGVKVGGRYGPSPERIETVNSFISQHEETPDTRRATYEESRGWYESITQDIFG